MKKIIFVVDDEQDIQDILEVNLEKNGYVVYKFSSAEEVEEKINDITPDLIILDIMMDGKDGYDFCKFLRSTPEFKNISVIFLSAKSEEFDKVLGLELGGDDYMTKPFSIKELLSRVKAVLRRSEINTAVSENSEDKKEKVSYKGVELFPDSFVLKVDNNDITVTKTEFQLLYLFMQYRGKVFSRDNIIDSIRGDDVYIIDRTIDVHIMNLRKKLGKYKNIIRTVSGVGYGFQEIND